MFPIVSPEFHRQMFDSLYTLIANNPFANVAEPATPLLPPCCCQSSPLFSGNAFQSQSAPQIIQHQGFCPSAPNVFATGLRPSAPQFVTPFGWNPCQQQQVQQQQQLQNQRLFSSAQPYRINLPLDVSSAELVLQVGPSATGAIATATTTTPSAIASSGSCRRAASQCQTDRISAAGATQTQGTKSGDGTEGTQTQACTQQQQQMQSQNQQNEKIDKASEADFCCLCCPSPDDEQEQQDFQNDGLDGRLVTRSETRQPIDTSPCKQGSCSTSGGQLECRECGCNTNGQTGDQPGNDADREARMREIRRSARERHQQQCSHAGATGCNASNPAPAARNTAPGARNPAPGATNPAPGATNPASGVANPNQPRQQNPEPAPPRNNPAPNAEAEEILSNPALPIKTSRSILRPRKRSITINTIEPLPISETNRPPETTLGQGRNADPLPPNSPEADEDQAIRWNEEKAKVEDGDENRERTVADKQQDKTREEEIGDVHARQKQDEPEVSKPAEEKPAVHKKESKPKMKVSKRKSAEGAKPKRKATPPGKEVEERPSSNSLDLKIKRIIQKHEQKAKAEKEERLRLEAEKAKKKKRSSLSEEINYEPEAVDGNRNSKAGPGGAKQRKAAIVKPQRPSKDAVVAPKAVVDKPVRTKTDQLDSSLQRIIDVKKRNAKAEEEKRKLEAEKAKAKEPTNEEKDKPKLDSDETPQKTPSPKKSDSKTKGRDDNGAKAKQPTTSPSKASKIPRKTSIDKGGIQKKTSIDKPTGEGSPEMQPSKSGTSDEAKAKPATRGTTFPWKAAGKKKSDEKPTGEGSSKLEPSKSGTSLKRKPSPRKQKKNSSDRSLRMAMEYGFANSPLVNTQPPEPKGGSKETSKTSVGGTPSKWKPRRQESKSSDKSLRMAMEYGFANSPLVNIQPAEPKSSKESNKINHSQTSMKRKPRKQESKSSEKSLRMAMEYGFANSPLVNTLPPEPKRDKNQKR